MRISSCLLSFALVTGVAPSQRTWIVDSFGAGDFTDIPPAIAAAAPYDTILVKGFGPYDLGVTIAKPLALISQGPSRFARGSLVIANLRAGETVTMSGFGHLTPDTVRCEVRECAGLVVLQRLSLDGGSNPGITILRSAAVSLADCFVQGQPALRIQNSHVTAKSDSFRGNAATTPSSNPDALVIADSVLEGTVDCTGGDGSSLHPLAGRGIHATRAHLRLQGAFVRPGSSASGPAAEALLAVDSHLELTSYPQDNVVFQGRVRSTGSTTTRTEIPYLATDGWTPTTPLWIGTSARAGRTFGVVAGLPTTPTSLPQGMLWLQPAPLLLVHLGTMPDAELYRTPLPLPRDLPYGLTFCLQAVLITSMGPMLSSPAFPVYEPIG